MEEKFAIKSFAGYRVAYVTVKPVDDCHEIKIATFIPVSGSFRTLAFASSSTPIDIAEKMMENHIVRFFYLEKL